jgi:thiamine pyrophosphate-dependent acetolactate synthase large subunit-like protein
VDPAAAAAAFGVEGVSVRTAAELTRAIGGALAGTGPVVIAARVDGPSVAEWIDLLSVSSGRGGAPA